MLLTDVDFGVSRILPVLVLLFYAPEGSTVILKQPEIHLPPAVQAGLTDVLIDAIKRRKFQLCSKATASTCCSACNDA